MLCRGRQQRLLSLKRPRLFPDAAASFLDAKTIAVPLENTRHIVRTRAFRDMFPADFAWGAGTAAYQIEGKQSHELCASLVAGEAETPETSARAPT